MARLPDLDTLGSRPVPVSRRGVASNPRAGAVAEALSGFGEQLTGAGRAIFEKEDKLAYSAARAAMLSADIAARKELENDPDYETWETKYSERMKGAREQASGLIRSNSDKALFQSEAQIDIERGSAVLAGAANGRRRDSRVAMLDDALAALSDVGQDATDDATREATINNASELISGAIEKGDITAQAGAQMRRNWTQSYIVQRVETLQMAGDLSGAQEFFEANKSRIDAGAEVRLANQLTDAIDNRQTLVLAEDFVHGGRGRTEVPGVSDAPASPDLTQMVAITARTESGNRERDANGRLITSSAGAQGRMQVMPATARDPGHGIRPWDGKTDADRSRVGEELLAALMRKYGNDAAKAWAAYNWGEGRVDRAVARHGDRWLDYAPDETRNYVRKNMSELGGTSQAPQRHDLNDVYARIDATAEGEGWTPERREAVKAQAARLVERDEGLLRREEADAFETVLARVDALGNKFTNVSQLGDAFYKLGPAERIRVRSIAEENAKPVAPPANGDVVRSLHRMAIEAPGQFASIDLRPYRAFMTPGEFDEISTSQARTASEAGEWSPRTSIQNAISWGKNFGGVEVDDGEDKYRVYRYMEDRARQFRGESGGKDPAEGDYQRWFREATTEVRTTRSFIGIDALAPDRTRRAYEVLNPNYRNMIRRQFRQQFGREPNEQEMQAWFDRMGEAIK